MGVCCSNERSQAQSLKMPENFAIVLEAFDEEGWRNATTEDVKEHEAAIKANLQPDAIVAFHGGKLQGTQYAEGVTEFTEDPEQYLNKEGDFCGEKLMVRVGAADGGCPDDPAAEAFGSPQAEAEEAGEPAAAQE